jgi:DNA-binding HxlR family transcriptional regulator
VKTIDFKRSCCPIANILETVGDKWTLLVIRDLFLNKRRFGDFAGSPEKMPTNILAERLKRLEDEGMIQKIAYQDNPVRYEYTLTQKGKDLEPILKEMIHWGLKHVKGAKVFIKAQDKVNDGSKAARRAHLQVR